MESLLPNLKSLVPHVVFEESDSFFWSPKHSKINYYNSGASDDCIWALLHETSHALLNHHSYKKDIELLLMEVSAWEKAKELAGKFNIKINEEHIQDCLDTYRDWLHQRATCPRCGIVSLQKSIKKYQCHNCHAEWTVSNSRFCRPYRTQYMSN